MGTISDSGWKFWVVSIIAAIMSCAVNSYALISGYVNWDKKVRYSKLVELWCQVIFYSVSLTLIMRVVLPDKVYLDSYINAILPITSGQYWYITAYFGLFFLMPYLNAGLSSMNKAQALSNICLLTGAMIVLPAFVPDFSVSGSYGLAAGFSTIWLAIMYLLGG